MKKEEVIKIAQKFCGEKVQVYPTQDYYLRPVGNQYGTPSRYPFPKGKGVGCVFDANGECMYVFIHTSWDNHFGGSKIKTSKWSIDPCFIVSLILEDGLGQNLALLQEELKQEIIRHAQPYEN